MYMNQATKNGYEAISGVSDCFAENQEMLLQMEKQLHELECVNDELQEENEKLKKLLAEAENIKTEDVIAEMKRDILKEIEEADGDRVKEFFYDIMSELLTRAETDIPEKEEPDCSRYYQSFERIEFEQEFAAKACISEIAEYRLKYKEISVCELTNEILPKYFKYIIHCNKYEGYFTYTDDKYGWDLTDSITIADNYKTIIMGRPHKL